MLQCIRTFFSLCVGDCLTVCCTNRKERQEEKTKISCPGVGWSKLSSWMDRGWVVLGASSAHSKGCSQLRAGNNGVAHSGFVLHAQITRQACNQTYLSISFPGPEPSKPLGSIPVPDTYNNVLCAWSACYLKAFMFNELPADSQLKVHPTLTTTGNKMTAKRTKQKEPVPQVTMVTLKGKACLRASLTITS